MLLYDVAWSQTNVECPPEEEHSILFVCVPKVRLQKQQDEDHERDADQRNPTHVQSATYPGNAPAKEEAVPAALQRRICYGTPLGGVTWRQKLAPKCHETFAGGVTSSGVWRVEVDPLGC